MRGSQTNANRCAQHKIKRTLAVVRDSPWERAGVRGGVGRGGWRGWGGERRLALELAGFATVVGGVSVTLPARVTEL